MPTLSVGRNGMIKLAAYGVMESRISQMIAFWCLAMVRTSASLWLMLVAINVCFEYACDAVPPNASLHRFSTCVRAG